MAYIKLAVVAAILTLFKLAMATGSLDTVYAGYSNCSNPPAAFTDSSRSILSEFWAHLNEPTESLVLSGTSQIDARVVCRPFVVPCIQTGGYMGGRSIWSTYSQDAISFFFSIHDDIWYANPGEIGIPASGDLLLLCLDMTIPDTSEIGTVLKTNSAGDTVSFRRHTSFFVAVPVGRTPVDSFYVSFYDDLYWEWKEWHPFSIYDNSFYISVEIEIDSANSRRDVAITFTEQTYNSGPNLNIGLNGLSIGYVDADNAEKVSRISWPDPSYMPSDDGVMPYQYWGALLYNPEISVKSPVKKFGSTAREGCVLNTHSKIYDLLGKTMPISAQNSRQAAKMLFQSGMVVPLQSKH